MIEAYELENLMISARQTLYALKIEKNPEELMPEMTTQIETTKNG
jgi:hypothetical protein